MYLVGNGQVRGELHCKRCDTRQPSMRIDQEVKLKAPYLSIVTCAHGYCVCCVCKRMCVLYACMRACKRMCLLCVRAGAISRTRLQAGSRK